MFLGKYIDCVVVELNFKKIVCLIIWYLMIVLFILFVLLVFFVFYLGVLVIVDIIKVLEGIVVIYVLEVVGGGLVVIGIVIMVYVIG